MITIMKTITKTTIRMTGTTTMKMMTTGLIPGTRKTMTIMKRIMTRMKTKTRIMTTDAVELMGSITGPTMTTMTGPVVAAAREITTGRQPTAMTTGDRVIVVVAEVQMVPEILTEDGPDQAEAIRAISAAPVDQDPVPAEAVQVDNAAMHRDNLPATTAETTVIPAVQEEVGMAAVAAQRGAGIHHLQAEALLQAGAHLPEEILHPVEEVLHPTEEAPHPMEEVPPAAVAVLHAKDFIYRPSENRTAFCLRFKI